MALAATLATALAFGVPTAERYASAVELLKSFEAPDPAASSVTSRDVTIVGQDGPIRARLYWRPGKVAIRPLVIAHGVHYQGIDEGRLVPFAKNLAASGMLVLTPELRDVIDYRITDLGVGIIADSVRYLRDERPVPVADGDVGVMGFSFAGGLSLVAAAEPSIRDEVAYVMSVGGYHDLERVMRFLITSRLETPAGVRDDIQAHEYGLVVAVYGVLEEFVPAADLPLMRDAIRAWLQEKRPKAKELAEQLTTPEGKALFERLEKGKLSELRTELLALTDLRRAELERLSPEGKLAQVFAPVYLLHGTTDTVIPPSELRWAELELAGRPHDALVSPLMSHVSVDQESKLTDQLALVDFMANLY